MADDKKESREYNPRWPGYSGILLMSLINTSAIGDVSDYPQNAEWVVCLLFGCLTFALSLLVLLFDRSSRLQDAFDFKEAMDGRLEGYVLLFTVVWWAAGVGLITRAGGIAYDALNIYFSAWLALFMCVHTLNEWGSAKDVISIQELTHISATLRPWYALFFSSLVQVGSAADAHITIGAFSTNADNAIYAVAVGAVSTFISMYAILVHYKIVRCCNIRQGGMLELGVAILLVIWWVIGVSVLTENDGVAATIGGKDCEESYVPGSNLYLSTWLGLFSSCGITVRWKAAQALQFAKAQGEKRRDQLNEGDKPIVEQDDDAI